MTPEKETSPRDDKEFLKGLLKDLVKNFPAAVGVLLVLGLLGAVINWGGLSKWVEEPPKQPQKTTVADVYRYQLNHVRMRLGDGTVWLYTASPGSAEAAVKTADTIHFEWVPNPSGSFWYDINDTTVHHPPQDICTLVDENIGAHFVAVRVSSKDPERKSCPARF